MNKFLTKALAVLLSITAIVSLTAILASCGKKDAKQDENMLVIVEDGVSSFVIIRPDRASQDVVNEFIRFRSAIVDICGCEMDIATDWVKKEEDIDPDAKEILLGNTNRPETKEVLETLEPNSWAVVNKGNKIVICANNDGLLSVAIDWFIENCMNSEEKTVKVSKTLVKTEGFGNDIPISLGGVSSYQIVYPKGSDMLAYYASLVQRETKLNGKSLAVVSDDKAATDNEIIIGTTARGGSASFTGENEYSIVTENSKVYINATDEDTLYYAVNYYIEYGLSISDSVVSAPSDYTYSGKLTDYYKTKWDVGLPAIGSGAIGKVYNIGTGLANDRYADTITDSYMHLVSNITRDDFTAYAHKLESFGFKKVYEAKTEENELWGFRLGAAYAYVHFAPLQNYIRVIWDKSSNCDVADVEFEAEQTGTTTFYQYSIDLGDATLVVGDASGWGLFNIIKLADNSLIMMDGGNNPSWPDKALKGLTEFLYDITGVEDKEALHIRLWYYTHPDDDHNGLTKPLCEYLRNHGYDMPKIDAVAFNYPSERANEGYKKYGTAFQMIEYMIANYPDVNCLKLHTGMVLNIGEVKMEILGSVENMVDKNGKIPAGYDSNDTTTIAKFTIGGKTFLITGDSGNHVDVQDYHLPLYSTKYFRSDVLQISHHGFNILAKLYRFSEAKYIIVPNSYEGTSEVNHAYFIRLVGEDNLFYAGNYNTAFEITNGEMTVKRVPRYDNATGSLDGVKY